MAENEKVNRIFKAIADPTRREIFQLLVVAGAALSLTQIAEKFDISRQGVTKHLELLVDAGMVNTVTEGRERFCMANLNALNEIKNWLAFYDKFWDDAIVQLDKFLANKK